MAEVRKSLQFFDVHYEELDTTEGVLPSRSLELAWQRRFEEAYRLLLPSASQQAEFDRGALRWAEVALYAAACGARTVAVSALGRVRRELARGSSVTVRVFRARAYAACALALLGRYRAAKSILSSVYSLAPGRRMRAIAAAVLQCVGALQGTWDKREFDAAMERLRECDAGGIAKALLSLPLQPPSRVSKNTPPSTHLLTDADEFIAMLLEAATAPNERTLELHFVLRQFAERLSEYLSDRDEAALAAWMHSFAERQRDLDALRTVLSFTPRVFEAFLSQRGCDAEQIRLRLSSLKSVLEPIALRPRKRSDGAISDILDEVDAAINGLVSRLDVVDPLTAEHSRAVASWCTRLARKLGFRADEIVLAARSGLVHDVGKIYTPREILTAPRSLTREEWDVMRAHAAAGESIVRGIPKLAFLSVAVRSHHERLDGKGYPDGMPGSKIPVVARLVAVADSFNAMIGRRPYRRPMPPAIALSEIERHRGTQFDPEIADAILDLVRDG